MDEIWKDIPNWEGLYSASDTGKIKSYDRFINSKAGSKMLRKGRVLAPIKRKDYLGVMLSNGNLREIHTIHRLIAKTFLYNPDNKPAVNHINGNKHDNSVSNLEWVTGSENMKHAVATGLSIVPNKGLFNEKNKKSKQVIQYNPDGSVAKVWPSTREAHRNGYNCATISLVCNGFLSTYKGYIWKYQNAGDLILNS